MRGRNRGGPGSSVFCRALFICPTSPAERTLPLVIRYPGTVQEEEKMSDRAQPQFDVEAPLSIDDAYDVFEAMYKACNRWRNIGGAFRVPDSTLSCIALEEDSAEDRLYRVIKAWLENGGGTSACTWALVAETLRKITVGRDDIAREVEKKYLKQMPRATQTMSEFSIYNSRKWGRSSSRTVPTI